jgi:hypothetical protein
MEISCHEYAFLIIGIELEIEREINRLISYDFPPHYKWPKYF